MLVKRRLVTRCFRLLTYSTIGQEKAMAMNDIDLKQLIIDNPEQGLSAALELYAPLVKSVVCRLLGTDNRQDTEECISDVFFKLYRGIAAFDPTAGTIKGYLCGIARHTALDYRRKNGRADALFTDGEQEIGVYADPADGMAAESNRRILQQTVNNLPPPDRDIFIMRYFFGLKIAEIAEKLSLDNKTVENKLYRGKKKLRVKLTERGVEL